MQKEVIQGENVPNSHIPFSAGVKCGQFLFISGQASVDLEGKIISGTFEEECRRSFDNLKNIVNAAGLEMSDVVQVRNYVAEDKDLTAFNAIYREYFSAPFPARTTLVACIGSVLKFEVDAVAFFK